VVLKAMPTGRANARPMTGSASSGDARCCRAPHHEGLTPHPEERALARVSKDEATELKAYGLKKAGSFSALIMVSTMSAAP